MHLGGRLFALEEKDGCPKVIWEYVTDAHAPGPPVLAPDGSLRLHCGDGFLHFISPQGKQTCSPVQVGEPLGYASPVVGPDGSTYVSNFDGGLLKVDPDGRKQQPGLYFRTRQKLDAAGIVHQGVLYIGSEGGYMFAIELKENRGANLFNHAAEQGYTGWYIHCRPALTEDGILVVAGRDEHLYGFKLAGKLAWQTKMPGQMLGSPVLDRFGHVYVGVSQSRRGQEPRGLLACIDGNSHKIRWEYKAAGPVESTPVIGEDDMIYFGDNGGVIHAVNFRGKREWTAQVEDAVRSAGTILAPGRLAFGLDNETLVVLECSSNGLAEGGWPKIGKTLGQCGLE